MVDTTDQWIVERTGISERHIAAPDVATSDMAMGGRCVSLATWHRRHAIDAILVCTVTPDMLFPSTACIVQHNLGRRGRGDSIWSRPAADSSTGW